MALTKSEITQFIDRVETEINCIISEMQKDPELINQGDCPEFAKKLVNRFGGVIVDGLDDLSDELICYSTESPVYHHEVPHCWVKIDNILFDAEAPRGVVDERELPIFIREE
jgi:hypothetical protein